MPRWLRNSVVSLLIGGVFLWVAVRDWRWDDIRDSLRPIEPGAAWLVVEGGGPSGPPRLTLDGVPVDARAVAGPTLDGRTTWALDLSALPSVEGWWSADVPGAPGRWRLHFRDPASRGEAAGDGPLAFAPGADGRARVQGFAPAWIGLYMLMFCVLHAARVWRWGVLLRPLARIGAARLTAVGTVGYMAIILLPLRLGEFVRPYLVTEDGVSFSSALATCVVERVLDGLAVCALLFGAVALAASRGVEVPGAILLAGGIAAGVFGATLVVLLLARWRREATVAALRRLGAPVSERVTERAVGLLRAFLDGLGALPDGRIVAATVALTVVYWAANIVGHSAMLNASGLASPSGADLTLGDATAVMAILAIGITLPAGPGFTGNFEAAARLGLSPFVAPDVLVTRGAAFIVVFHALTFLLQVGMGLAVIATGRVSLRKAMAPVGAAPDGYLQDGQSP